MKINNRIYLPKPHYNSRCLALLIGSLSLSIAPLAQALPFQEVDARSAAMGGVGVVTHARNSAYYNPSLLATVEADVDGIALVPVYGESTNDPDDVEAELDNLQSAIDRADTDGINASLTGLTDKVYQDLRINSATIVVPSELIGANAVVSRYRYHTSRASIGDNLVSSSLEHRAIELMEIGVGVGRKMDLYDYGLGDVQLGVTAKIMLFNSYGYREPLETAHLGLDNNRSVNNSMINFDIGFVKEIGVWKTGLSIKNIFSDSVHYGTSDHQFNIKPQFRVGAAYQSRRALLELDLDLSENEKVGFGQATRFAAVGWEYRLFGRSHIRLGVRQNTVGDKLTTGSAGIGIGVFGFLLDMAVMANKDEKAVFGTLGYEI